jgi:hypothetical protein
MPCLLGCLALIFPRIVIVLVVIFSDYIGQAYSTVLWPLLGFFFMPLTTLAYAWAWHGTGGNVGGIHLAVVIIAVLIDLGIIGGNARAGAARKAKPATR